MIDGLFIPATVTILATPGPTNTLLAAGGAAAGLRRSLALVPAELAGYAIAILAWGAVLTPAAAAWPALAPLLRAGCAAYLAVTALRLWRRPAAADPAAAVTPRRVFVTTLLNPKALVFAAAVFPAAAFRSGAGLAANLALFACILCPISLAWIGFGASILGAAAGLRPRTVQRTAAVVLALFAISLGVSVVV